MFIQDQIKETAKKLYEILPKSLQPLEEEIKQKFNALLQAAFAQMDLVSREEFDVQVKVLARTREKVEQLEKQITSNRIA